jgi:hypothetical protein
VKLVNEGKEITLSQVTSDFIYHSLVVQSEVEKENSMLPDGAVRQEMLEVADFIKENLVEEEPK